MNTSSITDLSMLSSLPVSMYIDLYRDNDDSISEKGSDCNRKVLLSRFCALIGQSSLNWLSLDDLINKNMWNAILDQYFVQASCVV